MICKHCGTVLNGTEKFCTNCGAPAENPIAPPPLPRDVPAENFTTRGSCAVGGCRVAAFVFMVLACVGNLFFALPFLATGCVVTDGDVATTGILYFLSIMALLPLWWEIPMTVHLGKRNHDGLPVGTAFKVCALLFVGLIPGILLLVDSNK